MTMDSARDQHTLEEVDATDLLRRVLDENDPLNESDIEKMEFICLGCMASKIPIAIKPGKIRVPHFRLVGEHEAGCDVDGYEKLRAKGLKGRVSGSAGFPVSYPNQLILPNVREVFSNDKSSTEIVSVSKNGTLSFSQNTVNNLNKNSNSTARTIKRLAGHYISFPYDRDSPLSVPGIGRSTYQKIFQKLRYPSDSQYRRTKIYFGKLYYKKVDFQTNIFRLYMMEGDWTRKQDPQTFFLEIDVSLWSEARKKVVKREIEASINETKKKQNKEEKQKSKTYVWLFFLGQQDTEDSFKFKLFKNDHRLACCIVSDLLNIPYKIKDFNSTDHSKNITTEDSHGQAEEPCSSRPLLKVHSAPPLDTGNLNSTEGSQPPMHEISNSARGSTSSSVSGEAVNQSNIKPSILEISQTRDKSSNDKTKSKESKSVYSYNSQTLPSNNKQPVTLISQQSKNLKKEEVIESSKIKNSQVVTHQVRDNTSNGQLENGKKIRTQRTNGLGNTLNIKLQQFLNWARQIWDWLRSGF